jgi:hypothetical protein
MNFDFYLLLKLTRSQEPKLRHSGSSSGSGQKFQLHAALAPQHCYKCLDFFDCREQMGFYAQL